MRNESVKIAQIKSLVEKIEKTTGKKVRFTEHAQKAAKILKDMSGEQVILESSFDFSNLPFPYQSPEAIMKRVVEMYFIDTPNKRTDEYMASICKVPLSIFLQFKEEYLVYHAEKVANENSRWKIQKEKERKAKEKADAEYEKRKQAELVNGLKHIYTGAEWSGFEDGRDLIFKLRVNRDGTVYGENNRYDFKAVSKKEAYNKLTDWGYKPA